MAADYINHETELLVGELEHLIQSRDDLRNNNAVKEAFADYKRIAQTPPAIVEYVRSKTNPENPGAAFTKEQLQLLMFATVARSSSTWGSITAEAALLGLEGAHHQAAIISDNGQNETGDSRHRPHSLLLYDNIKIFADTFGFQALTPESYMIARQIHLLRTQTGMALDDPESVERALVEHNKHIPHTPNDMQTALHYCAITHPSITHYHNIVLRDVLKLGEGIEAGNPHDAEWLGLRALELATREASSVDEHDTGKLSYIGAYGLMVDSLLGHVEKSKRKAATEWTRVHNDEHAGQAVGWAGAAEEGHAEDARVHAMDKLGKMNADQLASILQKEVGLGKARLDYWNKVVGEMKAQEGKSEVIPQKHGQVPPDSFLKRHAKKGVVAAGILLAGAGIIRDANQRETLRRIATADIASAVYIPDVGYRTDSMADAATSISTNGLILKLPGALERLFAETPDQLNDPNIVARAAHGVSLRTNKGVIEPDQTVFTYFQETPYGNSELITVTAKDFPQKMQELRDLMIKPHTVKATKAGHGR